MDVKIGESSLYVLGRTGHTLTFRGINNTTYQIVDSVSQAEKDPVTTGPDGIGTAENLDKNTQYVIRNDAYANRVTAKTMLVDAEDIAKVFKDTDGVTTPGSTDETETAFNNEVTVSVNTGAGYPDGYQITLKDGAIIAHTVDIPDTWENVALDLNGKAIASTTATVWSSPMTPRRGKIPAPT